MTILGDFESTIHNGKYGNTLFKDGDTITFSHTVKCIEDFAFAGNKHIQNVIIPKNVETIGTNVFESCCNLKNVTWKCQQHEVPPFTFNNCIALHEVDIQTRGLESIGKCCFDNNYSLRKISIPRTVQAISQFCFRNCYNMNSFTCPEDLDVIGEGAFDNCIALYEVIFNQHITQIGDSAFYNCFKLKKLHGLEASQISAIGMQCFRNCYNLKNVHFPSSIKAIGDNAFCNCKSLEQFAISTDASCQIGNCLFTGCCNIDKAKMEFPICLHEDISYNLLCI